MPRSRRHNDLWWQRDDLWWRRAGLKPVQPQEAPWLLRDRSNYFAFTDGVDPATGKLRSSLDKARFDPQQVQRHGISAIPDEVAWQWQPTEEANSHYRRLFDQRRRIQQRLTTNYGEASEGYGRLLDLFRQKGVSKEEDIEKLSGEERDLVRETDYSRLQELLKVRYWDEELRRAKAEAFAGRYGSLL